MNMSDAVFGLFYFWFAILLTASMAAGLITLMFFMVSEMWHPLPYYKHEHNEEWIKEHYPT